jgi:hypothetical protein
MIHRLLLLAVAVAGLLALVVSPALAGTWTISPTAINESSNPVAMGQTSISTSGRFTDAPSSALPPGAYPGDNGNQDTYTFIAPDLDEGADAGVLYNMQDGTEFQTMTQDDVNGVQPDISAATCIMRDPTAWSDYSCAATFGDIGTPPSDPDPSNFAPYYNFRDNVTPPTGNEAASVTAAGQTCAAWLAPGQTATCTASQPTQSGFSPTDPNNYQALYFVSLGSAGVTMTATDPFMVQLQQQDPLHECVSLTPSSRDCVPSTSCTMSAWAQTCMLTTSGGANSVARMFPYNTDPQQIGHQVSDQITIAPAPGATESAWYGVAIYAQSVLNRGYVDGQSIFDIIVEALGASAQLLNTGLMTPMGWNPGPDIGNGEDGVSGDAVGVESSMSAGDTLASGQSLRRGPFTLTMKPSGNLVEEVAVNGHRIPVWSSRTSAPGARATLRRDANLVVHDRNGRARWSTGTHGPPPSRLELAADGRVVLRAKGRRPLFATPAISYPWKVRPGASSLARELSLAPGDHLQNGPSRLTMKTNGNLVLSRRGKTLWTTRTARHPGAYAHLRRGRLVVATPHGRVVWASGRDGGRGRRLALRANGALVLTGAGRTLWTAGGGR